VANDLIPYFRPGQDVTGLCTAAVTGKRFVKISGNRTSGPGLSATAEGSVYRIAQAVSGDRAIGVSKYDAPINGMTGIARGGIVPVTAGAAVTAGQEVQSDALGKAIPLAAGKSLGVAMSGVGGADLDVEVALNV
jgi:Uncharacterized conserved protein (DUF2190)